MERTRQRYFTFEEVWRELGSVLRHGRRRREALSRLDGAFVQQLAVMVSQVNGCTVCVYEHGARALREGMSDADLAQLLSFEVGELPPDQAAALAFAQHYADSRGHVDPTVRERLAERYGELGAGDVEVIVEHLNFNSTATGTVESFTSRLRGRPVQGSELAAELCVSMAAGARLVLRAVQRRLTRKYDRVQPLVMRAEQTAR